MFLIEVLQATANQEEDFSDIDDFAELSEDMLSIEDDIDASGKSFALASCWTARCRTRSGKTRPCKRRGSNGKIYCSRCCVA